MLFSGNVPHKLDAKSRVSVLSSWLEKAGYSFQLLDAKKKGFEVIKCYTRASFEERVNYIRVEAEKIGATPREIDEYVGEIIGDSYEAEVNAQGKLLIPKKQRERLGLKESVTLVGRGAYFEIWNPDDYSASKAVETSLRSRLDGHFGTLL